MIKNCTIRAGLIGGKLAHSFSPQIHARLADYPYDLIELEKAPSAISSKTENTTP